MLGSAFDSVVELIEIGARQLHLPVFIRMPVKYLRAVVVTFGFVDQLTATIHNGELIVGVLVDIIDLQVIVYTVPIG